MKATDGREEEKGPSFITVKEAVKLSKQMGMPYSDVSIRLHALPFRYGHRPVPSGKIFIHKKRFMEWLSGTNNPTTTLDGKGTDATDKRPKRKKRPRQK